MIRGEFSRWGFAERVPPARTACRSGWESERASCYAILPSGGSNRKSPQSLGKRTVCMYIAVRDALAWHNAEIMGHVVGSPGQLAVSASRASKATGKDGNEHLSEVLGVGRSRWSSCPPAVRQSHHDTGARDRCLQSTPNHHPTECELASRGQNTDREIPARPSLCGTILQRPPV